MLLFLPVCEYGSGTSVCGTPEAIFEVTVDGCKIHEHGLLAVVCVRFGELGRCSAGA